jgi:hypothetical protein
MNAWQRPRRRRSPLPWAAAIVIAAVTAAWLYTPAERAPPPTAAPVVTQPSRSETSRPYDTHQRIDDPRCLAGTAALIAPPQQVHRWVDSSGRVHLSDRPPSADGVRDHTVRAALREPVEVVIEQRDATMPADVAARARVHAIGVGKVFGEVLGLQPADGIRLRIVFAGTDAAFRAEAGPRARSSTGVYQTMRRTMVVRVWNDQEFTLRILRHEIVHALIHEWIGSALPPAIEEGLATYFSHFETRGMGGEVDLDRLWRSVGPAAAARVRDPRALRSLLALDYDRFHGARRDENYDTAAALVASLMASDDTRVLLAGVLRTQRASSCTPSNPVALFDQRWPGGIGDLANQLRVSKKRGKQAL